MAAGDRKKRGGTDGENDAGPSVRGRRQRLKAARELAGEIGIQPACEALGVSRSTFYRQGRGKGPEGPRSRPWRALSEAERQAVLDVCHTEEFVDKAPRTIQAVLMDRGVYLCSPRTMYRILAGAQEVRERRDQARHPVYVKPELRATAPNQVWTWDITDLKGPARGHRYKLYMIQDLFSRLVVGWTIQTREDEALAREFHRRVLLQQGIRPGQLTLHADRGSVMTSRSLQDLLLDLQVGRSHSRPHVSNDNPYSEAQFKTLKYHPDFPERFSSLEDARTFCRRFFDWYNHEHRHSGIGFMPPGWVHSGQARKAYDDRQTVLDQAFLAHPERFPKGRPHPPALPTEVWINPTTAA